MASGLAAWWRSQQVEGRRAPAFFAVGVSHVAKACVPEFVCETRLAMLALALLAHVGTI